MTDLNTRKLKKIACEAIDKHADELKEINRKIWENPELSFEEKFAHQILTDYLESQDFQLTRHCTMETAFRATSGGEQGPCIGVISEYDGLPEVGHACGHNLIAESGVAAGIGIKAALEASNNSLGKVVVLGTPAEEAEDAGKIVMIDNGCFNDIDFCMMVHPTPFDSTQPSVLAICTLTATFKGESAHAAAFPWEGVNALDAAVAAYSSISMLRQQMKPTWRVCGVFVEGGIKPNIIPDRASLEYYYRATCDEEMDHLKQKLISCFEGAATSTGCTVQVDHAKYQCSNLASNPTMARLYQTNAESLGVVFPPLNEQKEKMLGSTDMGNVSHKVPSIHPLYSIDSMAVNHSYAFTAAAGTDIAHQKTLLASKALAMTDIDLYCSEELRKQVKNEFIQMLQ